MSQRIHALKHGALNEQDRLILAQLLIKAGYTVRIGKTKSNLKSNAQNIIFIEYWDGSNPSEQRKGPQDEN